MFDLILYQYVLKNGSIKTVEAENIYEAMEQLVRVKGLHPSQIKSIKEKSH